MEDTFFGVDESLSSWGDDISAATTLREDATRSFETNNSSVQSCTQIDGLRDYIKHTMKAAKDRKTLKLIEAALQSIQKFDETYEKVSRLRC